MRPNRILPSIGGEGKWGRSGTRSGLSFHACAGYQARPTRLRVLKPPKSGIMLCNRQAIWSQPPHDDKHPQFSHPDSGSPRKDPPRVVCGHFVSMNVAGKHLTPNVLGARSDSVPNPMRIPQARAFGDDRETGPAISGQRIQDGIRCGPGH